MEVNLDPTTVTAGSGAIVVIGVTLRKFYLDWMKSKPEIASAGAITEQFKALQASIAQQQEQLMLVKGEMHRMDLVIHRQQTKITRTEMLLRQFVGLIREKNILIPDYMATELDDLLAPIPPEEIPK